MYKIKTVRVLPRRDKFGIEHLLVLEGNTERLKKAFQSHNSASEFAVEDDRLKIAFSDREKFEFKLDKPLDDYYDDEINEVWKQMVMETLGMEEPYRFFTFLDTDGNRLGTVGFKQDCQNPQPIVIIYRQFDT